MRAAVLLAPLLLLTFACRATPPRPLPLFAGTVSGEAVGLDVDGAVVAARRWRPASEPRATVVLLPDDREPGAALVRLGERLAADGALVVAPERPAALAARYQTARALVAQLRRNAPRAPLFVIGRGDAGIVALRTAQMDAAAIAGVVVQAAVVAGDDPSKLAVAVSRSYFGGSREHAIIPLWDEIAALDEPLLVVVRAGDDDGLAVAHDLIDRSSSRDRAVRVHADPIDAAADDDTARWIAAHVQRTATPSQPPPTAPRSLGWASSLTSRGGVIRREGGDLDATAGVRSLFARGRIGWAGAYELDPEAATFMPVGLGARIGLAGQVALVGGIGLHADLGGVVPAEALLELPLGRHLRALTGARVLWEIDDDHARDIAASIDDVQLRVGLRFLGDRHLWQRASAGSGPFLGAIYRRSGDEDIIGLEVGLHYWGAR
jgi:alpha-beta hydrolase superfamily lysophospholipase